jgi:hypothetical protein
MNVLFQKYETIEKFNQMQEAYKQIDNESTIDDLINLKRIIDTNYSIIKSSFNTNYKLSEEDVLKSVVYSDRKVYGGDAFSKIIPRLTNSKYNNNNIVTIDRFEMNELFADLGYKNNFVTRILTANNIKLYNKRVQSIFGKNINNKYTIFL